MPPQALQALADELAADRTITADEALRLRQQIFPDGVVSREEAEALIALEARVANSDPAWAAAFVEAITDHVLQRGPYEDHVEPATAEWLMQCFGRDGARETEVEAVLKILERAESTPDALLVFARERLAALVQGRAITAADVELMRRCLYAGDSFVGDEEAAWLFAIDAESDGRDNDPSWRDLFVKAQLNHLTGRHAPALLDAEGMKHRQDWLRDTSIHPFSNLARIFSGGFKGYVERARELGEREQLETYYEAVNENAEEDAVLTQGEQDWVVSMAKRDGKLTANEQALLAELKKAGSEGA